LVKRIPVLHLGQVLEDTAHAQAAAPNHRNFGAQVCNRAAGGTQFIR